MTREPLHDRTCCVDCRGGPALTSLRIADGRGRVGLITALACHGGVVTRDDIVRNAGTQSGVRNAGTESGVRAARAQSGVRAARAQSGVRAARAQTGVRAARAQTGVWAVGAWVAVAVLGGLVWATVHPVAGSTLAGRTLVQVAAWAVFAGAVWLVRGLSPPRAGPGLLA